MRSRCRPPKRAAQPGLRARRPRRPPRDGFHAPPKVGHSAPGRGSVNCVQSYLIELPWAVRCRRVAQSAIQSRSHRGLAARPARPRVRRRGDARPVRGARVLRRQTRRARPLANSSLRRRLRVPRLVGGRARRALRAVARSTSVHRRAFRQRVGLVRRSACSTSRRRPGARRSRPIEEVLDAREPA